MCNSCRKFCDKFRCDILRITTKIVTFRKFKLLTAIFGMISCA